MSLTVGEDSTAVIDGTDITASSSGSNGVFATDSGTALVNDTSIETMADNSRGLDATYGGTILASKITADTQGDHSAIVATDRGGGSISLADATLSTVGSGSPLLYSTGDIQVNNVSGTSSGSQIAGMEGLNTILIKDSTLESTVTGKTASDPIANGIIIYQSGLDQRGSQHRRARHVPVGRFHTQLRHRIRVDVLLHQHDRRCGAAEH